MAVTVRKTRVVGNPGRRSRPRARPSGKPRKRNPGQIVGWTLGNPGRKANMAKRNRKRNAGTRKHHKRTYKRNPAGTTHRTHHRVHHRRRRGATRMNRRHYRRNPGMGGGIGHLVTNAVFVIVGALGSKLGAQMVLGTNNTGVVGYAGNAAAGGVLWFLAEKVMKNRTAAEGIIAGTAVGIILRVLNDYTPFGSYISQLGMGDYQMQSFVTPQVLVDPMHNADIAIPSGWAPTIVAPPPAKTMTAAVGTGGGGMSGMYGGHGVRMY